MAWSAIDAWQPKSEELIAWDMPAPGRLTRSIAGLVCIASTDGGVLTQSEGRNWVCDVRRCTDPLAQTVLVAARHTPDGLRAARCFASGRYHIPIVAPADIILEQQIAAEMQTVRSLN